MCVYMYYKKCLGIPLYSYFDSIHHINICLSIAYISLSRYSTIIAYHKHIIGQSILSFLMGYITK